MLYAIIGIPLTLLTITNLGGFMATAFRWFYKNIICGVCCCAHCCRISESKRRRAAVAAAAAAAAVDATKTVGREAARSRRSKRPATGTTAGVVGATAEAPATSAPRTGATSAAPADNSNRQSSSRESSVSTVSQTHSVVSQLLRQLNTNSDKTEIRILFLSVCLYLAGIISEYGELLVENCQVFIAPTRVRADDV